MLMPPTWMAFLRKGSDMPNGFRHASRGGSSCSVASEQGEDWRARALCREEDPELFFPKGTGVKSQLQAQEAKKVCLRCPVREQCLAWAKGSGIEIEGVWGGTWGKERAAAGPRKREYGPARNPHSEGKRLAMDHGADLLVAIASGQDPEGVARARYKARQRAVRNALRLLAPAPGQVPETGLERVAADPRLRELRDAGHSNRAIAQALRTQFITVEEALRILEQRDAATDRITQGVAA